MHESQEDAESDPIGLFPPKGEARGTEFDRGQFLLLRTLKGPCGRGS